MAAKTDASAKQGIISHMNKDHTDSLNRFLQHYHKLSGWSAYDAQMTDIDLNGFNVKASGKTYRIPFHPAMNSYSEARMRLVDMDKYAALYLKKSDITMKRYVPPYGKWLVGAIITVGGLYASTRPDLFEAQGAIGKHLGEQIQPAVHNFIDYISPKFLKYIAAIHVLEVLYFTRYVLPKHSVSMRAPQWWLWAFSVLIEGVGAQGRFKETIDRSRAVKAKQAH